MIDGNTSFSLQLLGSVYFGLCLLAQKKTIDLNILLSAVTEQLQTWLLVNGLV